MSVASASLAKMSADNGDEDEKKTTTTTTIWARPFVLVFLVARKLGTGHRSISSFLSFSLPCIMVVYTQFDD